MTEGLLPASHDSARPAIPPLAILTWPRVALILLVIVVLSLLTHDRYHSADVSWLITVAEKFLEGKVLYKDILETNPPGAVLLYLPATYLGKLTSFLPEDLVTVQAFCLGFASLFLAYKILPNEWGGLGAIRKPFLLLGAFCLFILPMDAFAQREHFATMLSLPMVASYARYAEIGAWPAISLRTGGILMAAAMLMLKPHFFLPGLFLGAYATGRARSLRPLWHGGILAAGLLGTALTLVSLLSFPHYLESMLPILRDVYIPARSDIRALLLTEHTLIAVLTITFMCMVLGASLWPFSGALVMFLTAVGFLTGSLLHGKGFAYQVYPALFYVICCYSALAWRQQNSKAGHTTTFSILTRTINLIAVLCMIFIAAFGLAYHRPSITTAFWTAGLDRPSIMMLSKESPIAFPLVRKIGGNWVDPLNGQWIAYYTRYMMINSKPDEGVRRTLEVYHKRDVAAAIATLKTKKPDLVLVDRSPALTWLQQEILTACPNILKNYRPIASANWVVVYRRSENSDYGCGS